MALSLPGERSLAAASSANPVRLFAAWLTGLKAARARRNALAGLLELDHARLRDLGITHADIVDAVAAGNGRTPGMILNAARSKNARS